MEELFKSGFEAGKVPSGFREKILQNLLSEVENIKGANKRPKLQKADLLFLVSCLASVGVITYGIILSEQTWANLVL